MGKTLFQTLLKITTNFKDWMVNAAATFVANLGMPYGEKLMKAVSHMAGVRIPEHQAREILKTGRGKQVMVHRAEVREPGNQRPVYAYRLTKDCGNVAYKDFLVKVINSDEKMNEIFGPTEATAEKARWCHWALAGPTRRCCHDKRGSEHLWRRSQPHWVPERSRSHSQILW